MRPSRMMGVEETDANVFLGAPYWSPGSPGVAFNPPSQRQNQTFGGLGSSYDGVGSYGDGVSAIEPVMTLSSHETPGRTARRRSMAGQLRREAQAFGRRSNRQALDGLGVPVSQLAACIQNAKRWNDVCRDDQGRVLDRNRRYPFDDDATLCEKLGGCHANVPGIGSSCWFKEQGDRVFPSALDPAFDYSIKLFNKAVEARTGYDPNIQRPTGTPTPTGGSVDVKSIINARLAQGKKVSTTKKKSKLVPIVAGVAAVGLIAWLL